MQQPEGFEGPVNGMIMTDQEKKDGMIKVSIYGTEYPLKTNGDDAEYIRKVAGYVDEMLGRIAAETGVNSVTKLAILAALNITDELFLTIEERDKLVNMVESKMRSISENLGDLMRD